VSTPGEPRELTVDGERFRVSTADDGTTHCDWLSGPNPGYGLSLGRPVRFVPDGEEAPAEAELSDDDLVESIRRFLAEINPETGYLD
jgi:hypothetical protein